MARSRDVIAPGLLVAGLGHMDRGDDGFGPAVVRSLRRVPGLPARLQECIQGPAQLLDLWPGVRHAWVVDAVRSGAPAGTLFVRDGADDDLPPEASAASTHGLSLPTVIGLARSVGRLPQRVTVLGVEAASLEIGAGLSPAVRAQVGPVVARITGEVRAEGGRTASRPREGPHA